MVKLTISCMLDDVVVIISLPWLFAIVVTWIVLHRPSFFKASLILCFCSRYGVKTTTSTGRTPLVERSLATCT